MKSIKCFSVLLASFILMCVWVSAALADNGDAFDQRIAEVVETVVTEEMDDYDKALALHDWVVDHLTYIKDDETYTSANFLEVALFQGKAVCQGYAALYRALLDQAGIENDYEFGTDHVWNMIRLGDTWYHVDCTWNDDNFHTYFCLPNEALEDVRSHECTRKTHEGHDWSQSYLYKYGHLDTKLNSIRDTIQSKFNIGIGQFQFIPEPSLLLAHGSGFSNGTVERNLVMQIIRTWQFDAGDVTVEPQIDLDSVNNALIVTAELPERPDMDTFDSDPEHFTIYNGNYINAYNGTSTKVQIPDGINSVYIRGNDQLRHVILPDSVTQFSFENCKNLQTIRMSPNVTTLYSSFKDCEALESVVLPEGLTRIGYASFQGCLSLRSVNIPSTVTEIANSAFRQCPSLSSDIVIPGGVEKIGYFAFSGDISLKSVVICEGVAELDEGVFSNCSALAGIQLPDSITQIGQQCFNGCSSLEDIRLPDLLAELPSSMFYGCSSLKSVVIPPRVKKIGTNVFSSYFRENTSHLESVILPDGLEEIGVYAFANCRRLPEITIPASVTLIDEQAFAYSQQCVWKVAEGSYAQARAAELGQPCRTVCSSHTPQFVEGREPTCTESGNIGYYICAVCGERFSDEGCRMALSDLECVLPPAGHIWETPEYTWDREQGTVTALRSCGRDTAHIETETVSFSALIIKPAGCEENGETFYFTDTFSNPAFTRQDMTLEDIPATGHDWSRCFYEWSDDHSMVTASRVCGNDPLHMEDESVSTAVVILSAPSENEAGLAEYTSNPFENAVFETQRLQRTIPALRDMSVLTLPAGLRTIESEAFAGTACQAVIVPEGCVSIGEGAFSGCTDLVYILIPQSVSEIADTAFDNCPNLVIDRRGN